MDIICLLLSLYLIVVFARVLLSWVRVSPGSAMAPIVSGVHAVTEPVMGPLRRAIPPVRLGGAALDLSPLVVLLGIQVLQSILC